MRLSRYFLPILKETPREAEIVSHRLMLRAGMIRQQGQGSFAMLPLGFLLLLPLQIGFRLLPPGLRGALYRFVRVTPRAESRGSQG